MIGFEYTATPHMRRHGPRGYSDYSSYRDWLRDEFTFRCVYCLDRELWNRATFHIEHLVPVSVNPGLRCEYSNLLYACEQCNEAKKDILGLPDPCEVAFHDCLRITADGRVRALNDDGRKLILVLRLDSERNVRYRSRWMQVLAELATSDSGLYQELMGFPEDLPDLRQKLAPDNTKPEGATNCYFALRERGELPAMY